MKESLYSVDKNEIVHTSWESEDKVREFGYIPNNITFLNGVAIFNGSSSYATSTISLKGIYSIRFRLTTLSPSATQYLLDCRANSGTGYIRIDSATAVSASSGTIYVDGVATSTISSSSKEIVVTGITLNSTLNYFGRINSSATNYLNASIDLYSVYNITLTANTVLNIFQNKAYKPFQAHGEILGSERVVNGNFSSTAWWLKDTGVTISGGLCHYSNVSNGNSLYTPSTFTAGKTYRLIYTISNYVSGKIRPYLGGYGTERYANGTYIDYLVSGSDTLFMYSTATGSTYDIDNISVKEVISTANLILDVNGFDGVIKNRLSGNVSGVELMTNGNYESGLVGTKGSADEISAYTLNTINTISGTKDGLLQVTQVGTNVLRPVISSIGTSVTINKTYRLSFNYKVNSGTCNLTGIYIGGGLVYPNATISGNGNYIYTFIATGTSDISLYFNGINLFNVQIDNISVQEIIPSVVNTAVTVLRSGNINSMFFYSNGILNMGSYNSLVGDLTIQGFIKPLGFGTSNVGKIVDNSKLKIGLNSTNSVINISSDGSTLAVSATNAISIGKWQHFCITRTSTGVVNIYINGILSGTANQASGTPASGSTIYIGTTVSSNYFNGEISNVQVFSGILSQQEISQIFLSEKRLFNL